MSPSESAAALIFVGFGGCYAVARLWRLIGEIVRGAL